MGKELLKQLPLYALVALGLTLIFLSNSPLWNSFCADQSMFSVIGANWAEGKLPYVDTWDSKGPIIFFMNMIGHRLARGEMGIFILQTINLVAVLTLSHYYLRRHCTLRRTWAYNAVFLMAYVIICSGGNQVGDTNLVLAVWSVMLIHEWSRGMAAGRFAHPWGYAFVYGMFASSCLLSRLTNAMLLVWLVAAIALVLMGKGLWRNLGANILSFAGGFAVVFVPFAVYFAAHGALGEMWYAMLSYNMEYALHSSASAVNDLTPIYPLYFAAYFICLIATVVYAAIAIAKKENRLQAVVWGAASLLTLVWLVRSYCNANYAISYLPVVFVAMTELGKMGRRWKVARWALYGVAAYTALFFANHIRVYRDYMQKPQEIDPGMAMTRGIGRDESFVAWEVDPTYYIYDNRKPCYRFFSMQDWAIENGPSLRPLMRDCYARGNAKWILVKDTPHCNIRDILARRYVVVSRDAAHGLTLYRIKRKDPKTHPCPLPKREGNEQF